MPDSFTQFPWALALIFIPLFAGLLAFLWPLRSTLLGLTTAVLQVLGVAGLSWQLHHLNGGVFHHAVGGWGAPLGIDLHADGLSMLMLAATALVGFGVSLYSSTYFERREAQRFWPTWLLLQAALNALFLTADIFNLYVTLELSGLAAVVLTSLPGDKAALAGAMRYLLAALLGSLTYLLGVALLYHSYGSVDIFILSTRVTPSPVLWAAFGLMGGGLLLKAALFPLHFWLPSAHASAPAPVSAVLSALVVKAAFYILLRLWLSIFVSTAVTTAPLLGLLGAVAVVWGSLQALRQRRLKLLIAYSTVTQIGYLFLAFPLGLTASLPALSAVAYMALSHALAKSSMFLAAGNLLRFGGHDRIHDLDRVVQRLPLTAGAFALAGVSIMGLPPSGGFIGKWLLLEIALAQGRWGVAAVILLGGLLAAAYVFKVLGHSFTESKIMHEAGTVPLTMEWASMVLALGAIALGLVATPLLAWLGLGTTFGIAGGTP